MPCQCNCAAKSQLIFAVCTAIAILAVAIYMKQQTEGFASKQEKVDTIYSWWQGNVAPTYSNYKKDITGSDVVEYNKAKQLHTAGQINKEKLSLALA